MTGTPTYERVFADTGSGVKLSTLARLPTVPLAVGETTARKRMTAEAPFAMVPKFSVWFFVIVSNVLAHDCQVTPLSVEYSALVRVSCILSVIDTLRASPGPALFTVMVYINVSPGLTEVRSACLFMLRFATDDTGITEVLLLLALSGSIVEAETVAVLLIVPVAELATVPRINTSNIASALRVFALTPLNQGLQVVPSSACVKQKPKIIENFL
jgi:hypothetical protein